MNQSVLDFVIGYLESMHIQCTFVNPDSASQNYEKLDLGLRQSILKLPLNTLKESLYRVTKNAVFHITDHYNCCYSLLRPKEDHTCLVIGPYLLTEYSGPDIRSLMETLQIPSGLYPQLEDYYYAVPYMNDKHRLHLLLQHLGTHLFHTTNVRIHELDMKHLESREEYYDTSQFIVPKDPVLSMRLLEDRYRSEDILLDAVIHGNAPEALKCLEAVSSFRMSMRASNELRDFKNRMIILNTLLRRTAYLAGVHPFYINAISSNFARMIEQSPHMDECMDAVPFMVKSYCNLVVKHSMASYSEPVRKILVTADASLTADLSLKRFTQELFLNASYLSALFKKEVGMSLTNYVNKNRIAYAKKLLQSTTLSVQSIAIQSGIPDIHYFTRLFKRESGLSPREWRRQPPL